MPPCTGVQAIMKISNPNPKNAGAQAIYLDFTRAFSLHRAKDD
jgi:hypothetical protein